MLVWWYTMQAAHMEILLPRHPIIVCFLVCTSLKNSFENTNTWSTHGFLETLAGSEKAHFCSKFSNKLRNVQPGSHMFQKKQGFFSPCTSDCFECLSIFRGVKGNLERQREKMVFIIDVSTNLLVRSFTQSVHITKCSNPISSVLQAIFWESLVVFS